jgi:glycosyltransferase involved in cell wall biosynthesis
MYDATVADLRRSPATAIRNWRALRRLRKADLLVTPSAERAAWLVGRTGLNRLPTVVLNSPARALARAASSADAIERLLPPQMRDRRLVIHTGGLSPSRAVAEFTASVEYWQSDAVLVVTNVGESRYAKEVRQVAAKSQRRDDIVLLPQLSREDMLGLQRVAAIGLNLMPSDSNLDIMFPAPNKIGEYLHAGLLVVASRSGFTERLADRGIAILTHSLDPQEIARAVDEGVCRTRTGDTRAMALSIAHEWYCMDVQLAPVLRAIGYA